MDEGEHPRDGGLRGGDQPAAARVTRTEWIGDASTTGEDLLAVEEPLEIRIGGVPITVVMRTPGHDEELAWGALVTERIVRDPSEVVSVRHCAEADVPEAEDNVVQVVLAPGVEVDLARLRRNLYASSSCGICGKATLENVLRSAPPLDDDTRVPASVLCSLPDRLRAAQGVFDRTGGLHAAGLFSTSGELLVAREDVGRHNAVDKVVGWAAVRGRGALPGTVLMVSGRMSYEIVQKALSARIPVVASVSAASSLAVRLGRDAGMTLACFVRGQRLCVYSGAARITRD